MVSACTFADSDDFRAGGDPRNAYVSTFFGSKTYLFKPGATFQFLCCPLKRVLHREGLWLHKGLYSPMLDALLVAGRYLGDGVLGRFFFFLPLLHLFHRPN